MLLANHTSRFDVAMTAIRGGARFNARVAVDAHETESYIKHLAQKERDYIYKHGEGTLLSLYSSILCQSWLEFFL